MGATQTCILFPGSKSSGSLTQGIVLQVMGSAERQQTKFETRLEWPKKQEWTNPNFAYFWKGGYALQAQKFIAFQSTCQCEMPLSITSFFLPWTAPYLASHVMAHIAPLSHAELSCIQASIPYNTHSSLCMNAWSQDHSTTRMRNVNLITRLNTTRTCRHNRLIHTAGRTPWRSLRSRLRSSRKKFILLGTSSRSN